MIKATVYKQNGKTNGEIELNAQVFGARINKRLLDIVLKAYAANQRRGTHDTKERGEVRGGGKKPWKQKGTGRARHASRRSPIWRGGGTVFGPHPRDYSVKLSEEMRRQALISVLSLKKKDNDILVLENLKLSAPKTKEFVEVVKALGLAKNKSLLIADHVDENLKRAFSNAKDLCSVKLAKDVSAYHIARRRKLVIEKQALLTIENRAIGLNDKATVSGSVKS